MLVICLPCWHSSSAQSLVKPLRLVELIPRAIGFLPEVRWLMGSSRVARLDFSAKLRELRGPPLPFIIGEGYALCTIGSSCMGGFCKPALIGIMEPLGTWGLILPPALNSSF